MLILGENNNRARKKKVAHDKLHIKTDIVCKFELNRLSSLGGESVTNRQRNRQTNIHEAFYT